MLYTEDFSMRHYVGFSQIRSHIASYVTIKRLRDKQQTLSYKPMHAQFQLHLCMLSFSFI